MRLRLSRLLRSQVRNHLRRTVQIRTLRAGKTLARL